MRLCEKTKSNISCCLLVLRYINTYSYLATYLTSSSTPPRTYCSISFVLILFEVISFDVLNICFLSICIISSPRSFVERVKFPLWSKTNAAAGYRCDIEGRRSCGMAFPNSFVLVISLCHKKSYFISMSQCFVRVFLWEYSQCRDIVVHSKKKIV